MAETIIGSIVAQSMVDFATFFNASNHTFLDKNYTIDVSYPNSGYEPEVDQPYVNYTIIPSSTSQRELGSSASNRHLGFIQLDIYCAKGQGTSIIDDVVADLKPYFRRGTWATLDSTEKVEYLTFSLDRSGAEGVYYRQIITVNYRSDLPNY